MFFAKTDPHSVYLTPQELTNADEQLQGNFDGIGVHFKFPTDTRGCDKCYTLASFGAGRILSGDRLVKLTERMWTVLR